MASAPEPSPGHIYRAFCFGEAPWLRGLWSSYNEPFEEKMARLTAKLEAQFAESARLEAAIRGNLRTLEDQG